MTILDTYLKPYTHLIENYLQNVIPLPQKNDSTLFEAGRYSLLAGGKRMRPLLTLLTAEMFGIELNFALPAAASLELIHTYSMIHDDLPCMDNDDYRRGKPTLHKVYSEGYAVLTGDFLLTYAFELLAIAPKYSPQIKLELIRILSQRSGAHGMIEGQLMDISAENQQISLEELNQLHSKKTGALICAAVEFGGVLGSVSERQMSYLKLFGEHLGLAFQIIDDILDITASSVKHGRSTPSDTINNKSTYVSLLGIEKAREAAKKHHFLAVNSLKQLDVEARLLIELADFAIMRNF
jgi:geranylgeranyl diphosphate synthase, type II